MSVLLPYLPYLLAMAALTLASGFFSCSEAALFYLGREDREQMARGGRGERAAATLLQEPERLLTSILFWNLVINMVYFAISSLVALKLERAGAAQEATVLAIVALFALIIVSEMLPKNLGVLQPRLLSSLLGIPLAIATRLLDPLLPTLQKISDVSERLVAPRFESEAYLELADLERAIVLSGDDPELIEQEQVLLSRVVSLSELRVEELMRPRKQYLAFTPPVVADDLQGQTTPSGYLLITESDSEEIAASLPVEQVAYLPAGARLDRYASPITPVPWCATAAAALNQLRTKGLRVAAVINELGETIGIVTLEDLLAHVLQRQAARRHPNDRPGRIVSLGSGGWQASGRTTLRRIGKQFGLVLPTTRSITVAGMLQEQLQVLPTQGDVVDWGGLTWTVVEAEGNGSLEVKIAQPPAEAPTPTSGNE